MANPNTSVMDVTASDFNTLVLEAPRDQVVMVDFWAPWCSPCKMLGPVLESLAAEYQERVTLAKVNVDENPELSAQYHVQGIPAVKIFKGGMVVDEFVGVLPEAQIKQRLEPHVPNEADDQIREGNFSLEQGQIDQAEKHFKQALEFDSQKTLAKLGLAKIAFQQADYDRAREYAKAIEITDEGYDEAQALLNRLDFQETDSTKEDFENRLKKDGNDLDARYGLAQALASEEQYREALEEFLTILKKDKQYKDGTAKEAMLKIFTIVGPRSPLADEYRDKLEWVLY